MQRLLQDKQGVSAVEFSLLAPVFLYLVLGGICYGTIFGLNHSAQELASTSARAAVAGLSDEERNQIAQQFIAANANSYVNLDASKLKVQVSKLDTDTRSYRVDVSYDASSSPIYSLSGFIPLPSSTVTQSAVMQRGGY